MDDPVVISAHLFVNSSKKMDLYKADHSVNMEFL